MFQIGDSVVYGAHGVCTVVGIEKQKAGGKILEYYILEPSEPINARFFVPVQNPQAVSKLRRLLTKEDIHTFLQSKEACEGTWIDDENDRKQYYKKLIISGDYVALLQMVNGIVSHKKVISAVGKRLHICDENFLRDALRLLNTEFSLALDMEQDEVSNYIRDAVEKW